MNKLKNRKAGPGSKARHGGSQHSSSTTDEGAATPTTTSDANDADVGTAINYNSDIDMIKSYEALIDKATTELIALGALDCPFSREKENRETADQLNTISKKLDSLEKVHEALLANISADFVKKKAKEVENSKVGR